MPVGFFAGRSHAKCVHLHRICRLSLRQAMLSSLRKLSPAHPRRFVHTHCQVQSGMFDRLQALQSNRRPSLQSYGEPTFRGQIQSRCFCLSTPPQPSIRNWFDLELICKCTQTPPPRKNWNCDDHDNDLEHDARVEVIAKSVASRSKNQCVRLMADRSQKCARGPDCDG
jgi:hypothetical protein